MRRRKNHAAAALPHQQNHPITNSQIIKKKNTHPATALPDHPYFEQLSPYPPHQRAITMIKKRITKITRGAQQAYDPHPSPDFLSWDLLWDLSWCLSSDFESVDIETLADDFSTALADDLAEKLELILFLVRSFLGRENREK